MLTPVGCQPFLDGGCVLGEEQGELSCGLQGCALRQQRGPLRRDILALQTVERAEQEQRRRIVARAQ